MTLTARELALLENTNVAGYVAAKNAARNAQAVAEGWSFWTTMPDDAEFLAKFQNVYELEHMYACGTYSDVYKEAYCGRPTHPYGELTLEELEAEIEKMCESSSEENLDHLIPCEIVESEGGVTLGELCPELKSLSL